MQPRLPCPSCCRWQHNSRTWPALLGAWLGQYTPAPPVTKPCRRVTLIASRTHKIRPPGRIKATATARQTDSQSKVNELNCIVKCECGIHRNTIIVVIVVPAPALHTVKLLFKPFVGTRVKNPWTSILCACYCACATVAPPQVSKAAGLTRHAGAWPLTQAVLFSTHAFSTIPPHWPARSA